MRRPWRILVAAGAALALTACTGAPSGNNESAANPDVANKELKGEISFQTWSLKNDRFTPYFEKLIKDFEAKHPGTKIKWMDQPGEGYEDKLLQQAQSKSLPDVVNLSDGLAYSMAKADQLLNLKAADAKKLDEYVTGGVEAYQFEGIEGSFGYPWYLGTDLNFWNMDQLKTANVTEKDLPTTHDAQFELASKVAKATNGKVKLISSMPQLGDFTNRGVEIYKDGKFVFNSPEAIAVVEKYKQALADGAMPQEALNGEYTGNSAMFKQSKVAWTTATAGFVSELAKEAPSILKTAESTQRIGTPPLFSQGLSVAKNSKNPDLALAFAQYVTNNDNQVAFLELAQGFFPGTKAANENPESFTKFISEPKQKAATEQAAKVINEARSDKPVQWTDAMGKYFQQQVALAIRGDIPAKDALDKAVKNANDTL